MACNNIIPFREKVPVLGRNVYVDPSARIMGAVNLGDNVAVLYGSIIRGDDDTVTIGSRTVVLELSLIEAPRGHPVIIGENVLVSHGAIIHGAVIGSGSLIGIGSRVLDGAVIGEESIIAAGALVPPGKKIPPRSLVMGVPGKIVRTLTDQDLEIVKSELEAVHRKVPVYREILGCNEK
ncbi:MAG: gamma carbonic anhydrase family protein [Desulfurococcales archaeon]|nr:gamma carbonic anhydrase family protein [Desulfurococcales archaeon]